MPKGKTDKTKATVYPKENNDTTPEVFFKTELGTDIATTPGMEENSFNISLPATYTTASIVAVTQIDSAKEVLSGKLNLVVYEEKNFDVILVPLTQTNISAATLQTQLNYIYAPAIIKWRVRSTKSDVSSFILPQWDKNFDNKVECATSGMFSNYTTEMNNIISQFKANSTKTTDKNTYYLFLIKGLSNGAAGYMPFGKHYGFVTVSTLPETAKTAAHELGHGAFNLYHTFSPNSQYPQTENTTDNLMDYSSGTELYKYQWDLIHDPAVMLSLLVGDEEGEYIYEYLGEKYERLFDHIYSKHNSSNTKYYDKVISDINDGKTDDLTLEFSDDVIYEMTLGERDWIEENWKIRLKNEQWVFDNIISSIKNTVAGQKMPNIIAQPNRIYLGKYTYEETEFEIAVYGQGKDFNLSNLFTKIKVGKYDDLFLDENTKHILVDINEGFDYWIMAFFEENKTKPSLIMQICSEYSVLTSGSWLKYLGILVEEREPIDGKSLEEIMQEYEILTAEEIKSVREMIEEVEDEDEDEKKELYLELQTKVEYRNQRMNTSTEYDSDTKENNPLGEVMCQLTVFAECLEYLGINNPSSTLSFPDYLEDFRSKNYPVPPDENKRTKHSLWFKLANDFNAECIYVDEEINNDNNFKREELIKMLSPFMNSGYPIMLGISRSDGTKGHMVRLQSINSLGLIVDDPYGKEDPLKRWNYPTDKIGYFSQYNSSPGYNSTTPNAGDNNLWEWDKIEKLNLFCAVYFKLK